ncbi:Sip1-related alpha-galactosidase [uncultured Bacteroides sp.]|uniref:Sip1-related alpha-galactosidase n=1 Tax=uncultured Bacteroides sp. TaxID=162156 RepID=UPI0025E7A890|nr:Sip1-related alpha-galactosidase [uncultured Bacteroides sp.]
MRRIVHIGIWILAGIFVETSMLAQNSFTYYKGKEYKDIAAYRMEKNIDLNIYAPSTPILYERQVPEKQNTLSYEIKLPSYVRGAFFSRDSRTDDYQWPNNTNRLLPWMFDRLKDITQENYPGIPSNARPSTLGDALLLQLSNGEYLFVKSVAGDNSLSWFQANTDGTLTLYASTLGKDPLAGQVPLLLIQKSQTVYRVFNDAYHSLMTDKTVSSLQKREDKKYFEGFDYLGWCTWEHYHFNIDEAKILNDIDAIEASGIPVRYVLIDDGHIANEKRRLTSLTPDKQRFPNGWTRIMNRKQDDKIKWMGLWYSLSGYWMGISADNDFPKEIQQTLYPCNDCLLPGISTDNIETFYEYYIHTMKKNGFDFLKIDNQSFTLPLYMGNSQAVRQAKDCNLALEHQIHNAQMGLMNCMAQNVINTDHTLHSAVTRVSIDYKKYDENMAKSHLFQSYTNTLLLGQTVWPDHDMFHSSDTVCGSLMARSKAISGGPVYLSDSPDEFISENILPLVDEHGKIFRPSAPAVPTPESILTNPLQSGESYRVFAPTGDEAVSIICYNLNTSPAYKEIKTYLKPDDYSLRENTTNSSISIPGRILAFNWKEQTAGILTASKEMKLKGFTDCLFHLCPIRQGWAVIGIQEKYLSPATVQILARSNDTLTLDVLCTGTLRVWVESHGKQELRSIPIKEPGKIEISK